MVLVAKYEGRNNIVRKNLSSMLEIQVKFTEEIGYGEIASHSSEMLGICVYGRH